jgi:hypothetical protein
MDINKRYKTLLAVILFAVFSKAGTCQVGADNTPGNNIDTALIGHLNRLLYDSVKVFYFNREKDETTDFSTVVTGPRIYDSVSNDTVYTMLNGSRTDDLGRIISNSDSRSIVEILKKSNTDNYHKDNPVGPYIPTVGFVFFHLGKPCAHLDIGPGTNKLQVEIFEKKQAYRYKRDLLGENTQAIFEYLITKYKLPHWVLSPY